MSTAVFDTYSQEKCLAELRTEWKDVQKQNRKIRAAQVVEWERMFEALENEQDQLLKAGKWTRGPGDVLSILGMERREIYHSAMLAWLLDPLASHGLGETFLHAFLCHCDSTWSLDFEGAPSVRIQREVARPNSRADIVIWSDTSVVVIENKVDATESEAQCDRIYSDFICEPGARFVFLTPDRREPVTATGDVKTCFHRVCYYEVISMLTRLLETDRIDKKARGSSSVANYLATLQREFL